jgi:hypothetical protein
MNKLIDAINIITALGWSNSLDDKSIQALILVRENAETKTNEELTPEELALVDIVNSLIEKKCK